MNRTSVLACIHRHLHAARMEPGGLRPLGELVPRIAVELRAGTDTSEIQASVIPIPVVAAFIDGFVSPQEELAICRSILVDNSVLAELVAGLLAWEEVQPNANALPALSTDLTARLLEMTSQAFPNAAHEVIAVEVAEQLDAPSHTLLEQQIEPTPIQRSITASSQAEAAWLRPTIAILAVAASLVLVAWWATSQSALWRGTEQIVKVAPPPEDREPNQSTPPDESPFVSPREDGLIVQAPEEAPKMQPEQPPQLEPMDMTPDLPQVVVAPSVPSVAPVPSAALPEAFTATPMNDIHWSKIAGLLARREQNSDYEDEAGWQGVSPGDDVGNTKASDTTQLLTLPQSRAEADPASGGRIVLAADTR